MFYNFLGEKQICWSVGCPSESHKDALSCHPPGVREHTKDTKLEKEASRGVGWGGVSNCFGLLSVQEGGHTGDQACVTHTR